MFIKCVINQITNHYVIISSSVHDIEKPITFANLQVINLSTMLTTQLYEEKECGT